MKEEQLFRAREFAKKTGVTVRTLHHYDRIGLLRPAGLSESGHRLYGKNELVRLERIAALKFIGLPLSSIRILLDRDASDLAATLRIQRKSIEKMRNRLDDVLQAITRAESGLRVSGELEWDVLKHIIELMEMHDTMEWVKSYYTVEQLADLKSRGTPEVLAQAEKDWKQLIADVEAALDEDPAGARAQALADRWSSLIEQFTGGDTGITANLKRLYSDQANWSSDFKKPFSDEAAAFIAKAMALRNQ